MSKRVKRSWSVSLAVRVPRKVKIWLRTQAKKTKQTTSSYVAGILIQHSEKEEVAA